MHNVQALGFTDIGASVAIGRVREAYALAENHFDFSTLVWLCHNPTAASDPSRIQMYIETFGEEFAFVLYEWYISQGTLARLILVVMVDDRLARPRSRTFDAGRGLRRSCDPVFRHV